MFILYQAILTNP